ncbi:MAG: hypothetical protein FWH26_08755 [Oscillospiraceae bacterium]|nr:hypothetical protein [Oscillospiraceae bacterium]
MDILSIFERIGSGISSFVTITQTITGFAALLEKIAAFLEPLLSLLGK